MGAEMQSFTASDGLKLSYRIDDYTDTVPDRCAKQLLRFLKSHA